MFDPFVDMAGSLETVKSADNESLTGSGVDMKGHYGVAFLAIAEGGEDADFAIKAQVGTDSAFADAADLAGTSITFSTVASPSTHAACMLVVKEPPERYVRAVVTVPDLTAAKAVSVYALRFGAGSLPESNTGESHLGPAEGTA